jgi:MFS superfamily sulfate permease-like transporter
MMVSTFLVTIVFDLTVAVELGLVLAVVLFVRRQSEIFRAEAVTSTEQQLTFRLFGSLFFGAVAKIDPIVAEVEASPQPVNVMLDATQLISLDTTGLDALEQLHKAITKRGGHLGIVGPERTAPIPDGALGLCPAAAHLPVTPTRMQPAPFPCTAPSQIASTGCSTWQGATHWNTPARRPGWPASATWPTTPPPSW